MKCTTTSHQSTNHIPSNHAATSHAAKSQRVPGSPAGRPNQRGMGLIAILVVFALLTFILIPLFSSFQGSRLGVEKSIYYLIASNLISSQLESMKALPYVELEAYVLGQKGVRSVGTPINPINGPYEAELESPDLIEEGVYNAGKVVFDRYTFISYFPHKNPNPSNPESIIDKQRIRIRVDVLWKEPLPGKKPREQSFSVSTLVHNENFNPRPNNFTNSPFSFSR